jgi:hypothetical protein
MLRSNHVLRRKLKGLWDEMKRDGRRDTHRRIIKWNDGFKAFESSEATEWYLCCVLTWEARAHSKWWEENADKLSTE